MSATSFLTISSRFSSPITVEKPGSNGKWHTTANWTDELSKKVVEFIKGNSFEFYGSGTAPTEKQAQDLVAGARERAEAGVPFTRFPILNSENEVIGEFALGFDDDPKKLQIAGRGLTSYQHQGIGKEILQWILKDYIPELHRNGVLFPVLAEGQGAVPWKDKQVAQWLDLKDVSVVATAHPENMQTRALLEKNGFRYIKEFTKENFIGVHDGRRIVYELALKTLFSE